MISFSEWRMAKKYGTSRDLVTETLNCAWERFWLCRVRRNHQEKFGSHGRCYRCGKAMR